MLAIEDEDLPEEIDLLGMFSSFFGSLDNMDIRCRTGLTTIVHGGKISRKKI